MLLIIVGLVLIGYLWIQQNRDARVKVYRALAYAYLWTKKKWSTPKFNFDPTSTNLDQVGAVPLREAKIVEYPRSLTSDVNAVDSIRFFGTNADGSVVCVLLERRQGRMSEVAVYLRLPNGEQYQLPGLPDSRVFNTPESRFYAAGLGFQVLEPLRKWRITFNGHLRKRIRDACDDDDNDDLVPVRFNFFFSPISNYELFPEDFNIDYMSKIVSTTPAVKSVCHLADHFPLESMEQFGQIRGQLNIGNQPEQVMLVRGFKKRKHGIFNLDKVGYVISIEGYTENATNFHLFAEHIEGGIPNFAYGYVNLPCNMKVHHISECKFDFSELTKQKHLPNVINIKFVAGERHYSLQFRCSDDGFKRMSGEQWQHKTTFKLGEVSLNGKKGIGIAEISCRQNVESAPFKPKSLPPLKEPDTTSCPDLIVSFRELSCQSSKIVGGKGSSLALMSRLKQLDATFSVPEGFCITNTAFALHLKENPDVATAITQMQNVAWKHVSGSLSDECGNLVKTMNSTSISYRLSLELKEKLLHTFGEDWDTLKFAVRSSAIGEDGEEMSAAGQNETILGVNGFDQILSAIITCWASQFAFRSVEYKRQNGQLLNAGMAVVVQQMVPADVAGVLFSREPLTGSLSKMVLTSNYGLGESVVSALADPDTITINRNWNDELSIDKKEIGKKSVMITMSENGTIEQEVPSGKSSECTVSDEDILRLAKIALFLEKCFGTGRDIEWAIHGGDIYLLQSRPVTNENDFSEFEILHEFDTVMKTDEEHFSTANVGEVMPGAMTPLTNSSAMRTLSGFMQMNFTYKVDCHRYDPTTLDGYTLNCGHFLFDQIQQKAWTLEGEKSVMTKAMDIGFYGRVLDDHDVCDKAKERFEKPPRRAKIRIMTYSLGGTLYGWYYMRKAAGLYNNYKIPSTGLLTIEDVLNSIVAAFRDSTLVFDTHMRVTFASNIWNLMCFLTLSGGKDLTLEHYTDFANIVGTGNGALSGEVPFRLRDLSKTIVDEIDADEFNSMSPEDALNWLNNNKSLPGKKFQDFLERHGHRCIQEFDLHSVSWAMDPIRLVKIIQDTTKCPVPLTVEEPKSNDAIASMKTQLPFIRAKLLSFILKGCKTAICQREQTKSWIIKYFDGIRHAFRQLADLMVKEGFLPDEDLLHFFTFSELNRFLKTRSANLLRHAKRRQRAYPAMNKLKFPEMMIGYPVPIDENEEIVLDNMNQIIGFPVSRGIVKGPAKVVLSVDFVHTIEPGDILIATATDIGWSPYFPMLAGVVTEIGGLISHGAVVAREFGLPCIVGAQHATKIFKTGDIVLLDSTTGIISKVLQEN